MLNIPRMTRPKTDDYLRLTGTLLDRARRAWHGHVVERFPAVDRIAHRAYGEWLRWSFAVR